MGYYEKAVLIKKTEIFFSSFYFYFFFVIFKIGQDTQFLTQFLFMVEFVFYMNTKIICLYRETVKVGIAKELNV